MMSWSAVLYDTFDPHIIIYKYTYCIWLVFVPPTDSENDIRIGNHSKKHYRFYHNFPKISNSDAPDKRKNTKIADISTQVL